MELADKQDANIMSICSLLIYWKKILGLPRILSFLIWIGGIRSEREFRQIELRGLGVAAQTKFRLFAPFLSTSEVGRAGFGGSSRQNQGILLCFCLLRGPYGAFLVVKVDKIKAFRSFFVYFKDRTGSF